MKKLLLTIFTALFLLSTSLMAQEVTITGKVSDAAGGMPGVSIQIKGTSAGTASNFDGNYRITANQGDVLVFSFVGYTTQEFTVGIQTTLNVKMVESAQELSEIVVIGYGTTTVQDATGSVAAVTSDDFNQGVIASPEQLIVGKTAGVQITSVSGAPGDGVQLRIRGANSIRSNNNPLFVVDGVPLAGGTTPGTPGFGLGSSQETNPLNFINPNDIESISILKDASATAIYGSRGANGVVIITTKSGKGAGGSWEFSTNGSIASPANKYDLLDPAAFLDAVEQYGGDRVLNDAGAETDWQDFVTRTIFSHKTNLAFSQGFSTGSIRASMGYEDQQGVLKNSYMKRFTARINGNMLFIDDNLNLSLQSSFSNTSRQDPGVSGDVGYLGDILGAAYSANPTWPTDPDFNPSNQRHPGNALEYYTSLGGNNRILTNFSAEYNITEDLVATSTYGLDWSKGDRVTIATGEAFNMGNGILDYGRGELQQNQNMNNLVELTLNYSKDFSSIDVELVGGYSYQSFRNQWDWVMAGGFTDPYGEYDAFETELRDSYNAALDAVNSIADNYNNWGISDNLLNYSETSGGFVSIINTIEGSLTQSSFARPSDVTVAGIAANYYDQTDYLQSYFGRGNFTISDKYMITATVRIDGSSKFGEDHRYGVFPSGAIAWKVHEESFMPDFFSTFKLRGGYGVVGNQDGLGYGEYIRRERWADVGVGDAREIVVPGTTTQGSVNPDLRWEETTQLAFGFDFGIIEETLYGSFDVYNKQTTDLLLRRNAAQPSLVDQIYDNLDAIVENKGWELQLTWQAVNTDDASFSISGNVSKNDNLIKDFAGELNAGGIYGQGLTGAYAQRLAGGHPLFAYHLREFEGFDANGQPIGDNQDYVIRNGKTATALPTWNAGVSITFRYMDFDFTAYMNGQFGHYLYNNTRNAFFTAGSINNARNVTTDVPTSGEAGSAEAAVSTRFLEKGDFWRMNNVNIGYTLPLDEGGLLNSFRVYISGQNLFVITDYTGLDPEVSTSPADWVLLNGLPTAGIDLTAYPRPRIFSLGLTASF